MKKKMGKKKFIITAPIEAMQCARFCAYCLGKFTCNYLNNIVSKVLIAPILQMKELKFREGNPFAKLTPVMI